MVVFAGAGSTNHLIATLSGRPAFSAPANGHDIRGMTSVAPKICRVFPDPSKSVIIPHHPGTPSYSAMLCHWLGGNKVRAGTRPTPVALVVQPILWAFIHFRGQQAADNRVLLHHSCSSSSPPRDPVPMHRGERPHPQHKARKQKSHCPDALTPYATWVGSSRGTKAVIVFADLEYLVVETWESCAGGTKFWRSLLASRPPSRQSCASEWESE